METKHNPFLSRKSASGIPFILCLAVFAILSSPLAMAGNNIWNGGAPSTDTWSNLNNWGGSLTTGEGASPPLTRCNLVEQTD